MNERVLIIVGIIAQYFMNEHDFSDEHEIVEELLSAGFEEQEINEAFTWMEKITLHPDLTQQGQQIKTPCLRIFSPEEQQSLSIEARGFLVDLRLKGILTADMEEEIILNACHDDDEPSNLDEVKSMTVLAMFADMQHDNSREIDCIIENKLEKLYH